MRPQMSSWLSSEPGLVELRRELGRLVRRANRRPILVILVTMVVVAGAVVRQARKQSLFDASVTFRVAEKLEGDPEEVKHQTKGRLREYVYDGIFTKQRVTPMVKEMELYPELKAISLNHAVEAFRDDIDVQVFKNFFLKEDWSGKATPRTARIRIQFTYRDADVALKVARALGRMVQEHEAASRKALAVAAARRADAFVRSARRRLAMLAKHQISIMLQLKKAQGRQAASQRVQLTQLTKEITSVEAQVARAQSRAGASELRAGLEKKQLLLRFELADWSKPPEARVPLHIALSIMAAVLFIFLLPLVGIGIAAFDSRIYTVEDVRKLELTVLGQVPPFPGHDMWSFDGRTGVQGRSRRQMARMARASRPVRPIR